MRASAESPRADPTTITLSCTTCLAPVLAIQQPDTTVTLFHSEPICDQPGVTLITHTPQRLGLISSLPDALTPSRDETPTHPPVKPQ